MGSWKRVSTVIFCTGFGMVEYGFVSMMGPYYYHIGSVVSSVLAQVRHSMSGGSSLFPKEA